MNRLIEEITIPLVWNPPPISCHFIQWLVQDGEHVCAHQGIYELEVDGALVEVESLHSGHMKQLINAGTTCSVGDRVATIVVDEISTKFRALPLYLSEQEIAIMDSLRGEHLREEFIRDTFLNAINTRPSTANKAVETTG